MHERLAGEVGDRELAALGERVVAPADEMEAIAAEAVGAQLRRAGADRGEREVGAARALALDAVL